MPDGSNYDPATDLGPVYDEAGKRYGWDPDFLRAQTNVESGGNPYAVSPAGAEGISQFIPSTAGKEGLRDPFDARESIPAQAKLMRENADQFGSVPLAVAAYHGGTDPSAWGEKTRGYLDAVNAEYQRLKAARPQAQAAPEPQQQAPKIGDQINTARQAGYSDDEIASYLQQSKTWAPKFDAARKAGYLDSDIFQHFGLKTQEGTPLTNKQATQQLPAAQTDAQAPLPPEQRVAGAEPNTPPTAPPPKDTGWLGAFTAGLGSSIRGGAQTYQALAGGKPAASEPTVKAAEPIAWGDVSNPGLLGRKFLYGIAASAPEIAGFSAGAALGGGPETPLGLAAGATGAAITHAATTLGPEFGNELKATPQDPDGAFNRAMKSTGVGAAFTGLGFASFGVAPFEGTLKNLMFQAFGVQPAVAVAQKGTENVMAGRPVGEDVFQAVPGAIAMTAAPLLAHAGARRLLGHGQAPQEAAPAAEQPGQATAAPPMGTPAPEAPVAQPRTMEEAALAELDPETEKAVEGHHADLAAIAKEEGVETPPWTKPGLRERQQYGPPAPPWEKPGLNELEKAGPPPPPEGTTRLYRVGPTPAEADKLRASSGVPQWLSEATQASGADAASGRWFTPDREEVEWYAREHPEAIRFVDVPNNEVQKYRALNDPNAAKFTSRPDKDFFLPTEISNRAETYGPPPPPWQKPGLTERERLGPPEAPPFQPPDVGEVVPRDPRVMQGKAGDFMVKTPNGWMVGSEDALRASVNKSTAAPRLAPAIKITDAKGHDQVYPGQVGELHMNVAEGMDPKTFQSAKETDLGFVDPQTGRYYTRDEAVKATGFAEASSMNTGAWPKPDVPVPPMTPLQERHAQVSAAEAERSQAAEEAQSESPLKPAAEAEEQAETPQKVAGSNPRPNTPFEAAPKEPQRLIDFLRSKTVVAPGTLQESVIPGGIKDPGGDLRAILGGTRGRPGLINNATGMSLHDKLIQAWENGYLPEYGEEPPTDDRALLDAIRDDHMGTPRYSMHDQDAVGNYQAATEGNREIDRLAAEHGIETRGKTREQFFDELHDRMSMDDRVQEIASQTAAHEAAYREAEQQAKQWVAYHGTPHEFDPRDIEITHRNGEPVAPEAWNAQHFYGTSQARTLEDLEREHAEEAQPHPTAPAPGERAAGDPEPGPPGGDQGAIPEGGGPRGGGAGDAERGAAPNDQATGQPRVVDFETYATQNGASRQDIGDAGLHRSSKNVAPSTWKRMVNAQDARNAAVIARRDELRQQYAAEVEAGRIRPPTAQEKLEETAAGNPDNASTQAAQRILAKRAARAQEAPTDLLGKPTPEPSARAQPEPTIRNDTRQDAMPGMEPSAVQAQAARDAQGRGALQAAAPQKPADEGLFAPDESGQGSLYSFPGAMFDPAAYRRAFGAGPPGAPNEVLSDKEGMAKAAAEIKAGFAPTSLRGAKPMEAQIRAHTSRSAQAHDIDVAALEKVRGAVDRLSQQEQIDFNHRMEMGQAQPTSELQTVAVALRSMLDGWAQKIQGLGKGYLANAIENYMGHIWGNYREWSQGNGQPGRTQAQMQAGATAANVRKAPLRGSGNFLKQRSFPTQLEGINAGLVPVTYNPVDLQLIKAHEMRKFYHGTVLADAIKGQGIAHWVRDSDAREALSNGQVPLDDTIFQPKLYGVTPIGPVEPGKWYAPEPAARVFNNYMSQGWANRSTIYDALRMSNNALNGLQLGIGGFHAAFVTNDVATSKVALGIQQIARGEVGRGGANLLFGTPVVGHAAALTDSLIKGGRVRREWLDPGSGSPETQRVVNAIKAGGFRLTMPDFFRSSTSGPFFKHWNDLKNPGSVWRQSMQMFRDAPTAYQKAVMTPIRIAARTLDTVMEPLMGALVPRAKAGVMYDLAADWLRRNPTATDQELSSAMTKFQDSVDNRLGQLNYDNLFWNKTMKDIAFITTRSVGWNLGTARELGGAFVDSGTALKAMANGRAPQVSTRMAYAIAMPMVTGMLGSVLTYLATGQGPQSTLDYFYPPTGTDTDQGVQERRSIPGYMKDVFAFAHDPIQTVLNKTSPMLEGVQELGKNRDYYGGSIYDPQRDRGPAQAYGDWLINQATPFSLRSWGRLQGEGAPALDQAMGFFGFQPAPASITNPERGEKFQRKEATKAYKQREKEVSKGLSVHIFNQPSSQP